MRIAAIDLGSNSFHLLVAEARVPASFEAVLQEKMMIQLGRTALISGRLDREAMEKGLRCLDEFRRMAMARGVERTVAVATSAIREAENGEEFLRRARARCGIPVRVISGREEARLIHLAVSRHVDLDRRKTLLVDVGGGSVEISVGDAERLYYVTSQKLGFLRLQGRFVTGNPMKKREERLMGTFLQTSLAVPVSLILRQKPERAVATSGTATTLLRLAQRRRGEGADAPMPSTTVSREEIESILTDMSSMKSVERAKKFDLDPLRAEYMPTALLCLRTILNLVGMKELIVAPVALREGLIYDLLARTKPRAYTAAAGGDLRRQAAFDLAARCDYPAEHSYQVARLSTEIFRQTTHLHRLGEREAAFLEHAAILHDVGYHIGYSKHHKHGYYLVMNCDLRGFTPEERTVLALLVRYHRRAAPKMSHAPFAALPAKARKTVKYLSAILRIADGLDRSHFSHVQEVRCRASRKLLHFAVSTSARRSDVDLDLDAAKRHARYFERLFGVETAFGFLRTPAARPLAGPGSSSGARRRGKILQPNG